MNAIFFDFCVPLAAFEIRLGYTLFRVEIVRNLCYNILQNMMPAGTAKRDGHMSTAAGLERKDL